MCEVEGEGEISRHAGVVAGNSGIFSKQKANNKRGRQVIRNSDIWTMKEAVHKGRFEGIKEGVETEMGGRIRCRYAGM